MGSTASPGSPSAGGSQKRCNPRRAKQGHSLALASLPRQVMGLTRGGDQGVDTRLDTGGHVGLTEVAGG